MIYLKVNKILPVFLLVKILFFLPASGSAESVGSKINNLFVKITQKTILAVVNITVWKKIKRSGNRFTWKRIGEGSGVIVSSNGFIVTNAHVISNGDHFRITLIDGEEYKSVPIGPVDSRFLIDHNTDIAIIKVGLKKGELLPTIPLGNSSKLRVGEWVIAVGNPFGLRQTVTAGIVSAKGRMNVGFADYENFIQTDAAINPGNSGGALVNLDGELVGINTAIKTNSGGYQGVSFAIPINMVKNISKMLLKYGKIVRGWMGFYTRNRPLTYNFRKDRVEVISVLPHSPAFHSGLKKGDIIEYYDGKRIKSYLHLRNLIATSEVGRKIRIDVRRQGRAVALMVLVGERPQSERFRYLRHKAIDLLGLDVQEVPGKRGVKIIFLRKDSPAVKSGLKISDIVMEVNSAVTRDRDDFNKQIEKLDGEEKIRVMVSRKGRLFFHFLIPEKREKAVTN